MKAYLLLFSILVLNIFIIYNCSSFTNSSLKSNGIDWSLLKSFLEDQYIPGAGLLRAGTNSVPDNTTIYIANDNVLATRALAVLGSPLASRVLTILNNKYNGGWNNKIDVLLGKKIPSVFYRDYKEYIGKINGYIIKWEKLDYSSPIIDWYRYADLLVYYALNKLLEGSRAGAEKAFINLTRMWDGYGFYDRAVNYIYFKTGVKTYAVYKCALFIYLYKALEASGSDIVNNYEDIYEKCFDIIKKAQDPVYGGIHTDYTVRDGKIIIEGDMNTETTSIVILALYSRYPEMIGEECKQINNSITNHMKLIGIYFYPWYSITLHRHWDETVIDKPFIGYYDSYNESVIRWQLELIKEAGIDFIVLSWWGPGSFEDNTTKIIVRYLREYGIKFAILIEPYINYTDPRPYNKVFWEKTIKYIANNYIELHRDIYFRLNGKPLILAFNPIGEAYDPRNDFQNYCIRIVGNDVDHGGYRDWDLWPDYDINQTGILRIRKDGYVAIAPRFDDEHFRPCGLRPYDPFLNKQWYSKQWKFVLSHLKEIRIILIYSWNEYHERSMIEPYYDARTRVDPWFLYNLTKHYIASLKQIYEKTNVETNRSPLNDKTNEINMVHRSNRKYNASNNTLIMSVILIIMIILTSIVTLKRLICLRKTNI